MKERRIIHRNKELNSCPRQRCLATLVHRHSDVDDLDDLVYPHGDLLEYMAQDDFLAVSVLANFPSLLETSLFASVCIIFDLKRSVLQGGIGAVVPRTDTRTSSRFPSGLFSRFWSSGSRVSKASVQGSTGTGPEDIAAW